MTDTSQIQCCFCGQSVASSGTDPVSITLPVPDGGTQELWSHAACLRRVLHPSVPLAI
jgi:hypothetical protein